MKTETIKPFYNQNGYTEFNNYVLDFIMPKLSPNAWKVLCFIIRKTKGWQKEQDQLSFSQIMDGTGIKNRTTVNTAINELEQGNYVKIIHSGDRVTSNTYSLNVEFEISIGGTEIVLPSTEIVLPPSTKTVPEVVRKSYSQKKGLNKDIITITPAQELLNHFCQLTGNHPRGLIDNQNWEDDSQDILTKANGDITRAKCLVDEAVVILKELKYPCRSPSGLLNTIDNMLKPKTRKAINNGRTNGTGKRSNGAHQPVTREVYDLKTGQVVKVTS